MYRARGEAFALNFRSAFFDELGEFSALNI